ncbi:MAG: acyl-protein synthetase [Polyangiaceae bacterium]|nr:acyl-protein synthetase [Polyangiaceae bacterium]
MSPDEERRARRRVLHARVQAFIAAAARGDAGPGSGADGFDALACDLARYQAEHVAPFGRLCRARGVEPARLRAAADIPALPTDAWKLRRIAAHPPDEDERVFRTSGTTQAARGAHAFASTATYVAGALAWARRLLWPDGASLRVLSLVAPEALAPDSSLGFMIARFAEALGGRASFHWDGHALDVAGVVRACAAARSAGERALVAGTAFAFVALADAVAEGACALPAGSRVMQTGGVKGRTREVEPRALYATLAARFAVPPSHVVGEYGMTELSSQLYEGSLAAALGHPLGAVGYVPPPWLRVTAVDPVSLAPLPPGARGLARFVDLANVDSAVAVQTADLVAVGTDGAVELFGRAPGAEPRGCSLAVEAALGEPDTRA